MSPPGPSVVTGARSYRDRSAEQRTPGSGSFRGHASNGLEINYFGNALPGGQNCSYSWSAGDGAGEVGTGCT